MAAFKKIAAAGLMMALAFPAMAYGAGETEYSQPIRDIKEQQAGVFQCEKDTEEWTREVILTASAVPDSGKTLPEFSFLWQGARSAGDGVYTVKENGVYTVKLQLPENSGLKAEDIQVDVQNIDTLGPEIVNVTKDISEWTSGPVKVTVECEDYQTAAGENAAREAERLKGSGLHPEGAYSFDGGKTWTKDNFITVEDNTNIEFVVRDALENETRQSITVDNIDKSEPTVRVNIADGGVLYEGEGGSILLSASASDNSSGLHAQPYSWDGGVSWTSEATRAVSAAGDYTVLVRDNAGNYTQVTMTVSYAQRPQQNNGGNGSNNGGSGTGSSSAGNNTYAPADGGSIYYGVPAAPIAGNTGNTNRVNAEKETKETESRETKNKKETESKEKESEPLKTPVMPNGTSSTSTGFPIRWILIAIGAVVVIIIAIVAAKLISDRQAAGDKWDDDDESDMSKVYARVSENESQTLKAAAAAASASAVIASKVKDEAKEETPAPETTPKAVAVSEAAPEAVDEPTVQMPAPEVVDEPTVRVVAPELVDEPTIPVAAPEFVDGPTVQAVAPEIAESAAVSKAVSEAADEAQMPEAAPEVTPGAAKAAPEPVVLEGAHSRLVYDPVTGEYKYELK